MDYKFKAKQAKEMVKKITEDKIKRVMFAMDNNKVLGPNEFGTYFFKKAWNMVGKDVQAQPIFCKDFRPISCYNTIYKCVTKIIANRHKGILS